MLNMKVCTNLYENSEHPIRRYFEALLQFRYLNVRTDGILTILLRTDDQPRQRAYASFAEYVAISLHEHD